MMSAIFYLPSFKLVGLSVQEKKFKIDFQNGGYGGHLEFFIKTILAIFMIYKSLWYFLPGFEQIGLFGQKTKFKTDFQDRGHLLFPIEMILAIFDLKITLILPTKFWVNRLFSSGREIQDKFSRRQPSWISDQNNFSYFWSTSLPDMSY